MQNDLFHGLMSHKHKITQTDVVSVPSTSLPVITVPIIPPVGTQKNIGYGYLYNWHAGVDVRNIANVGWRTPSAADFDALTGFVGSNPATKLREAGTVHWMEGNPTTVTDSIGFNLVGSGERDRLGSFNYLRGIVRLWTSESSQDGSGTDYEGTFNQNVFYQYIYLDHKYGAAIRLIKQATTLTNGETGTYTGNDGQIYPTINIGGQEWLSVNLAETKYRNGDLIPTVTDAATWKTLTSGAKCAYDNNEANVGENKPIALTDAITSSISTSNIVNVNFSDGLNGYLYNYKAVESANNLCNVGFRIATGSDFLAIMRSIEPTGVNNNNTAGKHLKSADITSWQTDLGDNSTGFKAVGSGFRRWDGIYSDLKLSAVYWATSVFDSSLVKCCASLVCGVEIFSVPEPSHGSQTFDIRAGLSVRAVKIATTLTNGQRGIYTGNDGTVYETVCIGGIEITTTNISETKYRTGDLIPTVTDAVQWTALTSGAKCAYNNDEALISKGVVPVMQSQLNTLTSGGAITGFKFVTQAVYDALVTAGTIDTTIVYLIEKTV